MGVSFPADKIKQALEILGLESGSDVIGEIESKNQDAELSGIISKTTDNNVVISELAGKVGALEISLSGLAIQLSGAVSEVEKLSKLVVEFEAVKKTVADTDARGVRIEKAMTEIRGLFSGAKTTGDGIEKSEPNASQTEAVKKTEKALNSGAGKLNRSPSGAVIYPRGV